MSTSETTAKPRVLIIGGGLGGLALAQVLRKHGIAYELFERDEQSSSRFQGWCIALMPRFFDSVVADTPDDMPPLEEVSHLANYPNKDAEISVVEAASLKYLVRHGAEHGSPFVRADRAKLRSWLLTNINVRWGKRFARYEVDADGVTAYFEDGSSARGDVLVGADGVHSRVRDQLLPLTGDSATDVLRRPQMLPAACVWGEVVGTRDQYERWMEMGRSMVAGTTKDRHVVVALKGVADNLESARYYWGLSWPDTSATREDAPAWHASRADMHAAMLEHIDPIHPMLAEALRATPVDGMVEPALRLRDMVPPQLPPGRVTLLGDAVHPMTPFRGEGGNNALADGVSLANSIRRAFETDGSGLKLSVVADALKQYEAEMGPRATESVLGSRANTFP